MNDCQEWQGRYWSDGYGRTPDEKRAHRVAYARANGPIPDGLRVCHKCDNPACVNVDHLFLGTDADNVADKVSKGRQAKGSDIGVSKLKEKDVAVIKWCLDAGVQGKRLAGLYGVSGNVISRIRLGKIWRHVPAMEYMS